MTGSAERRTTPAALPAVSAAPQLAAVTVPLVAALSRPTDDWAEHLNRLLYLAVRVAVANGCSRWPRLSRCSPAWRS
jgi:hypothetical protein